MEAVRAFDSQNSSGHGVTEWTEIETETETYDFKFHLTTKQEREETFPSILCAKQDGCQFQPLSTCCASK